MPHRDPAWNTQTLFGNPTKSKNVNDLIKFVKLKEVRREGKESSARRALTQIEFRTAIRMLSTMSDFKFSHRITTMMKLQYHLISRCDDLGHFRTLDLHGHSDNRYREFALEMKVTWSKNLHEEWACPEQILLGSMDTEYCLLLALSTYLESWLNTGGGKSSIFLFSEDRNVKKTPEKLKTWYSNNLSSLLFNNDAFFDNSGSQRTDKLGSHSLRKYPATWASRNDCSADEIDVRGRWKRNNNRVVNIYIDPKQQYMDGKVQAALCVGGPVKYKLVDGSGITKGWCEEHVVPGIVRFFGPHNTISEVLSLPLLYACFDSNLRSTVPLLVYNRIVNAYSRIRVLDAGTNPVKKILLNVYRVSGRMCIDELCTLEDVALANNSNNVNPEVTTNVVDHNGNRQQSSAMLNVLLVQNMQLKQYCYVVKICISFYKLISF